MVEYVPERFNEGGLSYPQQPDHSPCFQDGSGKNHLQSNCRQYHGPGNLGQEDGEDPLYASELRLAGRKDLLNPRVEIILPVGRLSGHGEEVTDGKERVEAMRLLMKGSGLNSSLYGFDPSNASDEAVAEKIRGISVIRIKPD